MYAARQSMQVYTTCGKLPKVLCTQSTAKHRVFRVPKGCNFLPSCCQWCPPWSSGFSNSFSIPTAMTKAPTPNQNPGIRLRMFACLLIAGWYLHASNLAQGSFRTLTSLPEEFIASKVENRANFCRNILLGNVFTKLSLAAKPSRVEYCTSCTVSWDSREVRLVNNKFSRPLKLIRLISNREVGNVNSVSIFFPAVWLLFVNLKVFNFDIGILRALCIKFAIDPDCRNTSRAKYKWADILR